MSIFFFFQAEDGIRDYKVTGVQTCALPIWLFRSPRSGGGEHPWALLQHRGRGDHRVTGRRGGVVLARWALWRPYALPQGGQTALRVQLAWSSRAKAHLQRDDP